MQSQVPIFGTKLFNMNQYSVVPILFGHYALKFCLVSKIEMVPMRQFSEKTFWCKNLQNSLRVNSAVYVQYENTAGRNQFLPPAKLICIRMYILQLEAGLTAPSESNAMWFDFQSAPHSKVVKAASVMMKQISCTTFL